MSVLSNGVEVPTDKYGEPDIYAMPNLQKRRKFIFHIHSPYVVQSVIRHRLRRYTKSGKHIPEVFKLKLPEFSSYTIIQLQLHVIELSKRRLPKDVDEYIRDDITYYPEFDEKKYINMCHNYAGPGPVKREHFVKIILMTSYMVMKLLDIPNDHFPTVSLIWNACSDFFYKQTDYAEYLNGYPWQTWYNPLVTIKVTNEEVVKAVVRSRLTKIFDLWTIKTKTLYKKYPSLVDLFKQELPEYASYQIRCIIDELEDYDYHNVKTYDTEALKWLLKWIPNEINITEYVINTDVIYKVDQGLEGTLKVFHFTCHIIEHLFGKGYHSEVCDVIKTFLTLLDEKNWPYKAILKNMPWHMWYKQPLPNPEQTIAFRSSFDLRRYMYPIFDGKQKGIADKACDSSIDTNASVPKAVPSSEGRHITITSQVPESLPVPLQIVEHYETNQPPIQQHAYEPENGPFDGDPETAEQHDLTQKSIHQHDYNTQTGQHHEPTLQYSYDHQKDPGYKAEQHDMNNPLTHQTIQQYAYDPQTGQHNDPTQQQMQPYIHGTQIAQQYNPTLNPQLYTYQPTVQWHQTVQGQQTSQPAECQQQTLQQFYPTQHNSSYNIDPTTGELVASGYQAVRGPNTGPLYMNINTGQLIGAKRRLAVQTRQTLPSLGNVGLQKQLLAAMQQQQLDTRQLLPSEQQEQATYQTEQCD